MLVLMELRNAIESLPDKAYSQLREWFLEYDRKKWDKQIEEDSKAGKLDFLIDEALEEKEQNKLKDV